MKWFSLFSLLMVLGLFAGAQPLAEQQVTDLVTKLTQAMIDADKVALDNLTSDNLSYGHSSGRVEDKQTFVENIVNGKSDFVNIDITEQTITISGNVALVRHIFSATTNDSGNPGSVKLKVLLVWQQEKGHWKLLARQAVKMP
jgi:ketosteroid isomerase-like protein